LGAEPVETEGELAIRREFSLEECPGVGKFIFKLKSEIDGMGDVTREGSVEKS
jgi:hypothetical protein